MNHRQNGFTLVEVLVVLPMLLLTITAIGGLLVTYYTELSAKSGKIELQLNSQMALFTARDDLFYAVRFAGIPQPDATDSHSPSGGWNAVRDNALIVYEAAYTENRQSVDRQLIYKNDMPEPCGSDAVTQNQYATNTLIYFLKDGTLYKRTLVPDQSLNCATTFRKQSCPKAAATPDCSPDTVIAENVKEFNITYYRRGGEDSLLPLSQLQANPDQFIQVTRADIELVLEKTINAEPVQATAKISIKKIE